MTINSIIRTVHDSAKKSAKNKRKSTQIIEQQDNIIIQLTLTRSIKKIKAQNLENSQ